MNFETRPSRRSSNCRGERVARRPRGRGNDASGSAIRRQFLAADLLEEQRIDVPDELAPSADDGSRFGRRVAGRAPSAAADAA